MKPGDVFVTNDPWMGTGHLFDYVMVTPAFRGDQVVAFFASTCHVTDVGGRGFTADANSIYEEGVLIPHMRIRSQDLVNDELLAIIAGNSRNPIEVIGDIRSLISCNDAGIRRFDSMMLEFGLENREQPVGTHPGVLYPRDADAIRAVPDGIYATQMTLDGYETPIS
ncbi:MAG: hypothetical protein Ct9H300mP16_13740 [Pseudomonadota bacterium]|nr:MAG: hypothetical protein Ct9H300mP16_13740 [Pseudomonadota bacterium]